MLEVIENALLNPEISRHFVSEMLCFYFVIMTLLASIGLMIGIVEGVDDKEL